MVAVGAQHNRHQLKAFTLVELILTAGLFVFIVLAAVPIVQTLLYKDELNTATDLTVRALRTAQQFAESVDQDGAWGVHIQSGTITVFQGTAFVGHTTTYDQTYDISSRIAVSGTTDYIFARQTGLPGAAGTITLTDNGTTSNIVINAKGKITY